MAVSRPAVIDADGHIVESDAELFEYLPPPFKGKINLFTQSFFPALDGYHRAANHVADHDHHGRGVDRPTGEDWAHYLDEANIGASILFPTAGLAFGLISDPRWADGLAQGYNNWISDRFWKVSPERLKYVALIPVQDPDLAAKELRRAVTELGAVGAVLPAVGLRHCYGHKVFWPIYEAAQELNVMLGLHGGPSADLGLDALDTLIQVRTLTHGYSQMRQMTSMMFGGVFDAFPTLRFAFCEGGSGWVPYLAERMDMEFNGRRSQVPFMKKSPSEHLQGGNIFIHSELGERGFKSALELLGEDVFFCASDYPHEPKKDFDEGLEELANRTDVTESAKQKIRWDNPLRLYNLDEARVKAAMAASVGTPA